MRVSKARAGGSPTLPIAGDVAHAAGMRRCPPRSGRVRGSAAARVRFAGNPGRDRRRTRSRQARKRPCSRPAAGHPRSWSAGAAGPRSSRGRTAHRRRSHCSFRSPSVHSSSHSSARSRLPHHPDGMRVQNSARSNVQVPPHCSCLLSRTERAVSHPHPCGPDARRARRKVSGNDVRRAAGHAGRTGAARPVR
jgi:hypothetical protein